MALDQEHRPLPPSLNHTHIHSADKEWWVRLRTSQGVHTHECCCLGPSEAHPRHEGLFHRRAAPLWIRQPAYGEVAGAGGPEEETGRPGRTESNHQTGRDTTG